MCRACRLRIVGWLYVILGTIGFVHLVAGFFLPLERIWHWFSFTFSVGVVGDWRMECTTQPLLLFLGVGLLKRSRVCRIFALVLNWALVLTAAATVACVALSAGQAQWEVQPCPINGDSVTSFVEAGEKFVVIMSLFVWQFWVLASRDSKKLVAKTPVSPAGLPVATEVPTDTSR